MSASSDVRAVEELVDPAALMPDRPVARLDIGLVGAVAVAHQGSGVVAEELGRMPVPAGAGNGPRSSR